MAIQKQAFYEGAALHMVTRAGGANIRYDAPFFFLDNRLHIFLKYSTKGRSPWGFTFTASEQVVLAKRRAKSTLVIGLICGSDGVATLAYDDYCQSPFTAKLDAKVANIKNKSHVELSIEEIKELIALTKPDEAASEYVWNPVAVGESLLQFAKLHNQKTGIVYVDRDRGLKENRRETQGILDGGEAGTVPKSRITLFLLRTRHEGKTFAAWWPQVRFPDGRYAFAFSI